MFLAPLPSTSRGHKRPASPLTEVTHTRPLQPSHLVEISLPFDAALCMSQTSQSSLPETSMYSAFDSDDDVERVPETPPSPIQRAPSPQPGPSRFMHYLPNDPRVIIPGVQEDDDLREYLSDYSTEDEDEKLKWKAEARKNGEETDSDEDDIPPPINQVGRGRQQPSSQSTEEEDDINLRYVNDIYALRSK